MKRLTKRKNEITVFYLKKARKIIKNMPSLGFSPHARERLVTREIIVPNKEFLKNGSIEELYIENNKIQRIVINVQGSPIFYFSYVIGSCGNLITAYCRKGLI